MNLKQMSQLVKGQMAEATGLKPETVIGAFHDEKGWHIVLEMLEMSRIPTATDVMGDYEALLDEEGALLKFERKKTRLRSETFNGAIE